MVPVRHRRRRADPPVLDRLHARRRRASRSSSSTSTCSSFSMLMLVLGDNLLLTFLGWEGVGACSYFLISFWFTEDGQRRRRQEGVRHEPRRRLGLHGRDVPDVQRRSARSRTPSDDGILEQRRRARRPRRPPAIAVLLFVGAVRQVGPAAALRLAARRHGRPDAGLGAHPRRHHGHRRRLPDGPREPDPRRGVRLGARRSSPGSAPPPRCSRPRSPSASTTSRRCSPTRRSASSATCSWPSARARTSPPSSTWSRTRSSRRCCSSAPAR